MTKGLLLDASADLVDHAVGDPCDVKGVGHPGGVSEVRTEPGAVGVGQVEGHHPDAPPPALRALLRPSPQPAGVFPLEEVDHEPSIEVHEGGGVGRRVGGGSGQVGVLVDAESPDGADPPRVLDGGSSVVADGAPGRVPTDPVLTGHRSDRPDELADLAGDLGTGPEGEDLPRGDALDRLCPGLRAAPRRPAPPAPFAHDQAGRSPEAVEVPKVDVHPVLGFCSPPA